MSGIEFHCSSKHQYNTRISRIPNSNITKLLNIYLDNYNFYFIMKLNKK